MDASGLISGERLVLRQVRTAAYSSGLVAIMAILAGFFLYYAPQMVIIGTIGFNLPLLAREVLGAVIAVVVAGTIIRDLALDEVADRALVSASRAAWAAPLLVVTLMLERQAMLPHDAAWVGLSLATGCAGALSCLLAVQVCVGRSGSLRIARSVTDHPLTMTLLVGWITMGTAWSHHHHGFPLYALPVIGYPALLVAFAIYDDAVGIGGHHRRRVAAIDPDRVAMPYGWPLDAGRDALAAMGLVRPGGQLAIGARGGFVGGELKGGDTLGVRTLSARPTQLMLGVLVAGSPQVVRAGLHVRVVDDSGTTVHDAPLTASRPRIALAGGRHHVSIWPIEPGAHRVPVQVWWVLGPGRTPTRSAPPHGLPLAA